LPDSDDEEPKGLKFGLLEKIMETAFKEEIGFRDLISLIADGGDKKSKIQLSFQPYSFSSPEPKHPELLKDLEGLEFVGLVKSHACSTQPYQFLPRDPDPEDFEWQLTEEGMRIAKGLSEQRTLPLRPPESRQTSIFIASSFGHEDVDRLYESIFRPSCEDQGLKPVRIDLEEPSRAITDAILDGIGTARCVIADLTYARPSVYFEVGFGHGIGVPLLLTCRSDHQTNKNEQLKVHFDLRQYKISYWSRDKRGAFRWGKKMHPRSRLASLLAK
jgi:hypothetical protein